LRVKTRLGSTLEITLNHPLRKLLGWVEADRLVVGDKIASLRTLGQFGSVSNSWAGLVGLWLGDGHSSGSFGFTQKSPEVQRWFSELLAKSGHPPPTARLDVRSGTTKFYLSLMSDFGKWVEKTGLKGKLSESKFIPEECFQYDRESTRDLLRGLWATDGHCKNVHKSKVDLVYCSVSQTMARQVRLLLRKFGIVTVVRENTPTNKNANKAYVVRVVTRKSIEAFHREIGPVPGKTFSIPDVASNSNLDTLPKDIHEVVVQARKDAGTYWQRDGFQSKGHCVKRAYCPTYEKIAAQQKELQSPIIQKVLDSDIIWDEIASIENIGVQPTWALQTATETYISDFVVNHNTTFLGNNLVISSVVRPYNKALYVSPSHSQTRQFSNEKLKPVLEQSPLIKRYFQDSFVSQQVFEKGFTNGSYIFLRSAFRTADRTRGISARQLCLDELQDFYGSEIPVIMECTSHFPDSTVLMAGTPKSFDNPIEQHWENSSQNEWMVRCPACNHWNFLDEKNIAPTVMYVEKKLPPGPVCSKCVKPINPATGQWQSFSSMRTVQGYRIAQIMVPWIVETYEQWLKLLWKRDTYPMGQLYNEVLGLSYDNASKPITKAELTEICDPGLKLLKEFPTQEEATAVQGQILVAGVDWGEGNDGADRTPTGKLRSASYTVLTIGTYVNQKIFKVLFMKRYTGNQVDPDFAVRDIVRICKAYGISLIGVDYGHGWGVNNQLVRMMGAQRVVQFQYLPKQKKPMIWDPLGFKYMLLRNLMISEFFYALKARQIILPRWEEFETFGKDLLSVFTEWHDYLKQIRYDHRQTDPDDSLHSMLYAKLAGDVFLGKRTRV
jgi:intein/homing endonuclease